ncbi:MAG TPA: prephenate dehydratase [Solibacterales bacterium]|nr:prephenate dehydratase [Bryobacterales bacterium]
MKRRNKQVAFQGERGAFSEEAVYKLLGPRVEVAPCARFEDVFRALDSSRVHAAVIPIENTLHGSVHENYDHLLHFDVRIVGETNLRIVHNLIAPPGVTMQKIKRVLSHPVAINQCLKFFAAHPGFERVPHYDTAGSVKTVMETQATGDAAIASAISADIYGARILKRSIEDDRQNFTRFFLLERAKEAKARPQGQDGWKTSLVFSTRNQPGSLFRGLSAFALRDISLTKIESRPIRGKPWEYMFYVDFLGHVDDPKCAKALGHLAELADYLRVLGCYPRGSHS